MKKQCKKVPFEIKKRENRLFEFLNDEVDCADDRKLDKEIVHKRDNNGKPVLTKNTKQSKEKYYSKNSKESSENTVLEKGSQSLQTIKER
jgi:hypothetical protein